MSLVSCKHFLLSFRLLIFLVLVSLIKPGFSASRDETRNKEEIISYCEKMTCGLGERLVDQEGSFGVIYRLLGTIVKFNPGKNEVSLYHEISYHKYIIPLIFSDPSFLVMKEACGGELLSWILDLKDEKFKLSLKSVQEIFRQLTDALEHIHDKKIIHRDLSLRNIFLKFHMKYTYHLLIGEDGKSWGVDRKIDKNESPIHVLLGDFGLSCKVDEHKYLPCGTLEYIAPEIFFADKANKRGYGLEADIWSLGVILYILIHNKVPLSNGCHDFTYLKEKNEFEEYMKICLDTTELCGEENIEIKKLISTMLSDDPEKRPTIQEIRKHPWLQKEYKECLPDLEECYVE